MPLFFLSISLSICGLLWFHTILELFFLALWKMLNNFDRGCIESLDCLGNMDTLTILILPLHEHGYLSNNVCLLQFPSSISYSFQCTNHSPPWLNLYLGISFFLKYISLYYSFWWNCKYCFVNFSFNSSLLVYRNTTDFCILILYPAILLNLFIISTSFLVESLGFSIYSIMSSANSDSFTCSFSIWMPFNYLTSLSALA